MFGSKNKVQSAPQMPPVNKVNLVTSLVFAGVTAWHLIKKSPINFRFTEDNHAKSNGKVEEVSIK